MSWALDQETDKELWLVDQETGERSVIDKIKEPQKAEMAKSYIAANAPVVAPDISFEYDANNNLTGTRNKNGITTRINNAPPSTDRISDPSKQSFPVTVFDPMAGAPAPTLIDTRTGLPPVAPQQAQPAASKAATSGGYAGLEANVIRDYDAALKAQNKAVEKTNEAINAQATALDMEAKAKDIAFQKDAQRKRMQEIDAANAEAARQDQLKLEMQKLNSMQETLNKQEIKPWADRSAGNKLGLAIMAGLMELGSALRGQASGSGLRFIEGVMDRDVQMQKEALAQKKGAVDAQQNVLGLLRVRYGEERSSEAALRVMQDDAALAEVNKIMAKSSNETEKAKLEVIRAGLEERKAQHLQEFAQNRNNALLAIQNAKTTAALQQQEIDAKQQAAKAKDIKDLRVPGLTLTGERVPSEKEAEKASEDRAVVQKVLNKVKAIRAHMDEYGTEYLSMYPGFETTASKTGRSMMNDLYLELKNAKGLGVLTGPDMGILEQLAGNEPNQFWQSDVTAILDNVEQSTLSDWQAKARQYGYVDNELDPSLGGIAEKVGG